MGTGKLFNPFDIMRWIYTFFALNTPVRKCAKHKQSMCHKDKNTNIYTVYTYSTSPAGQLELITQAA